MRQFVTIDKYSYRFNTLYTSGVNVTGQQGTYVLYCICLSCTADVCLLARSHFYPVRIQDQDSGPYLKFALLNPTSSESSYFHTSNDVDLSASLVSRETPKPAAAAAGAAGAWWEWDPFPLEDPFPLDDPFAAILSFNGIMS